MFCRQQFPDFHAVFSESATRFGRPKETASGCPLPLATLSAYTADVSKTPDKRRRSDLDLFVLALIDGGIATPYELQRAASLSPGATLPALRRLAERRFVLAGQAGPRGRLAHKLTAAGRQQLNEGWKELIANGPSGDFDADLRVALLALFVGGSRSVAVDFLRKSAARKLESLNAIQEPDDQVQILPPAYQYRWLRAAAAKSLIKAEAAAAAAAARSLSRESAIRQVRRPRRRLKRP
jgi:DNA-binding PadR family transcriptional regulator